MKTLLASLITMLSLVAPATEPPNHRFEATNVARLSAAEVNALVEVMRTNNPALRAQEARVRASGHATNTVRTWSDPMVSFGGVFSDGARGPMLEEEGDLVYELEQPLPLFGKAAAARDVAQREADVELSRASMEFQNLRRDLAKLLFTLANQEQSIEIGQQDSAWLQTMTEVAEERYRAGTATQVEVLRMQNERAKRTDSLRTETRRRDQSQVSLNRFLNRPLQSPHPKYLLPDIAPAIPLSSNLVNLAVRNEPRLRLLSAEIKTAEAQTASTRKARLPEVAGFLEGRQYSGDGGFREATIGVKLTLPWLNAGKYRSDLARDRARVQAAQYDAENMAQLVREEAHQLVVEIDAARREALLYRDEILPRSRLALETAHANWIANRGMFNDVMESRRMLLEAQLMLARAVTEQHRAMSELVLCCGLGDLESLEAFRETDSSAPSPINIP